MAHHFKSGEGAIWAQRSGPNTAPVYLGCHQLGDVDQPEGDLTLIYCPDESGPNRFKVVGSTQGAPGAITTSLTTDVTDEFDELERAKCEMTLFVNMSKSGRKDVFMNFDRTFIFTNVRITSRGLSNLTARTPDDANRSEQSYDLSAESLIRLMEPSISRQSISETKAINDITFCNDESCRTDESVAQDSCQVGYAATDAGTGVSANVLKTVNGGTWAVTSADPFGNDENISAIDCFDFGRDVVRVMAARGTTDAGAPAEIAYTDDGGATWTSVSVGSTNGQFVPTAHSLFALDRNNIWIGVNAGYIYKSEDAGATWTAQDAGVIHVGAWNAIRFADENVGWAGGAANILARTLDGGTTWSAISGPGAQAGVAVNVVEVLDRNRVWVGYANGKAFYTLDAGANWSERSFPGSGVGQVRDILFYNDNIGYMLVNNASPVGRVLWTIDGGYTFSALDSNTNAGYNAGYICDEWTLFVAGEAQGGTGYIAKATV